MEIHSENEKGLVIIAETLLKEMILDSCKNESNGKDE